MRAKKCLTGMVILLLAVACSEKKTVPKSNLSKLAMQGEQVFEKHQCGSCHTLGEAGSDSLAPDLMQPFIANDSLYVQAHLKFVQETKMPDLHLTPREIRLVSYYVAELHNSRLPKIPESEVDAFDPVCYAPVSTKRADQAHLHKRFLGKDYYFATEKCMKTFEQAPEAFVMLYEKFLEENARMNESKSQGGGGK